MKTVHVTYPSIMKMEICSILTVSENTSLEGFKQMVFKDVWEKFRAVFPQFNPHGSPEQIQLWDDDLDVRLTSESWQASIRIRAIFEKNAL